MPFQHTRRAVLAMAAAAPALTGCAFGAGRVRPDFAAIEAQTGGRIGVAASNLATDVTVSHRPDERFAMCSTFKWLLAAQILERVDRGEETLSRRITFARKDLVSYSPVTENFVGGEGMTVDALCAAAVITSDNTAANLLIDALDGPAGFTAGLRAAGDVVTRLDRMEPALNHGSPDDPRDTSSPLAMMGLMRRYLFKDRLSEPSRTQLRLWMIEARTGLKRLRAGLPEGWTVGDKTGTWPGGANNPNGANNDVAFAIPPGSRTTKQGPLIIVSFTNAPNSMSASADAVHAAVAREVVRVLT